MEPRKLENHYLLILLKWAIYIVLASIIVFGGGYILGEWVIPYYQTLDFETKKEVFSYILIGGTILMVYLFIRISIKVLKDSEGLEK